MAVDLPTTEGSKISTIDTGATISSVNERNAGPIDESERILVKGIGGNEFSLGVSFENIILPKGQIRQKFHVLPDKCQMPNGRILGMDFMDAARVVIDVPKNKLHLNVEDGYSLDLIREPTLGDSVNFCDVITKANLTIPARTQIRCKIPLTTTEKEVIILPQELPEGIFMAGSWSAVKNGEVDVSMINPTESDVYIPEMFMDTRPAKDFEPAGNLPGPESYKDHNRWNELRKLIDTTNLLNDEKKLVYELCEEFCDVFYLPGDKLSTTKITRQKIHLKPDTAPQYVKPYRNPFHQKDIVMKHIEKMKQDGVIEPSVSAWNAPLLIVPKKGLDANGEKQYRVVIDYRKLNTTIQMDRYPLPNINELIDQLGSARVFTCIDLSQGYYQVELEKESRPCTAFITPDGKHYQMRRLPMGLNISPSAFSRIMALALAGLTGMNCLVYLDDLIIFSKSRHQHYKDLISVFERLREVNLKVHPRKSHFFQRVVMFLGFKISEQGVQVDPEKCEKVREWPEPRNKKELQSFLGLANFYRHFVKNFADISIPLTQLLKKRVEFTWSTECDDAFESIKKALCSTDVLAFPNFDQEFLVHTDASKYALGAVLSNYDTRPVHFASRTMKPAEVNYSTIEKELLAVVFALKVFRPYLLGKHFTLNTDHAPLVWLFGMNNPASRLTKFRLELEQFHFSVIHVPGKDNVVADALSRRLTSKDLQNMHRQVEQHAEQYAIFVLTRAQNAIMSNGPGALQVPKAPLNSLLVQFKRFGKGKNDKLIVPKDFEEKWAEIQLHKMIPQLRDRTIAVLVDNEADTKTFLRIAGRMKLKICAVPRPRYVGNKEDRAKLMREAHNALTAGHGGMNRTYRNLIRKVYWPNMAKDVSDYVNNCIECKRMKKTPERPVHMTVTDSVCRPMEKILLDLVGPIQIGSMQYILTIQDNFSKFLMAVPLRNKESKSVAKAFVEKWVMLFGAPEQIVTDMGLEFRQTFEETCKLLDIEIKTSTAYHHQTVGSLENAHKTLGNYLRIFTAKNNNWPELLPFFQFAYNNTIHGTTKYAPMEIVFTFPTALPKELRENIAELEWPKHYEGYVEKLKASLKIIHEDVVQNLINSKLKNIAKSTTRTEKCVKVGDEVMVRRGNRKKMDPVRDGLFKITSMTWPNVTLENNKTVHLDRVVAMPTTGGLWLAIDRNEIATGRT